MLHVIISCIAGGNTPCKMCLVAYREIMGLVVRWGLHAVTGSPSQAPRSVSVAPSSSLPESSILRFRVANRPATSRSCTRPPATFAPSSLPRQSQLAYS